MEDLAAALNDRQRKLMDDVFRANDGRDLREILIEQNASAEDKAAVAEVLGGPGAGQEFLR